MVCNLYPGDVQSFANMGSPRGVHHHGLETGRHIGLQFFNRHQFCPVLIASGKMADQIPEGENIQIGKLLGFCRTNAL